MIRNVSPYYNVGIYNTPNFRSSADSPVTNSISANSVPNMNMRGIDALAAYNAPMIKQKDDLFDIPVVDIIAPPQELETVEGERVYGSNGELECVIQNNGSTKTVYRNDGDDNVIEIYDSKTNELLKQQVYFSNIDEEKMIAVHDIKNDLDSHYKINGDEIKIDGKGKNVKYPNGDFTEIYYDCDREEYHVHEYPKASNGIGASRHIMYDKNKNLIDMEDSTSDNYNRVSVRTHEGVPYAVDTYSTEYIPNNLGPDWQNDTDLIPAERYALPENPTSMEGVKTYYSNGNVETIENENGKFYFDFKGDVVKVEQGNKRISWRDNQHIIVENLGENTTKETIYFDNDLNSMQVEYKNNNNEKSVWFENGKIRMYTEDDGNRSIQYEYNKDGQVTSIGGYDIEKDEYIG